MSKQRGIGSVNRLIGLRIALDLLPATREARERLRRMSAHPSMLHGSMLRATEWVRDSIKEYRKSKTWADATDDSIAEEIIRRHEVWFAGLEEEKA